MTAPTTPSQADPTNLARRVDELRAELTGAQLETLAQHSGGALQPPEGLCVELWGRPVTFASDWVGRSPDGQELPAYLQALLLYYLRTADGTPLAGRWIAFSELPEGKFYQAAFQGYTGKELARHLGEESEAFAAAAIALGGERDSLAGKNSSLGDRSFVFRPLPRLPILAVYWAGDEDFPANYQLLFDASAPHYLPTDVCAILGGMLTRKLIQAAGARQSSPTPLQG